MRTAAIAVAASLVLSPVGAAAGVIDTVTTTRDTLAIPFNPGTGNPNTDFAITRITEDTPNTIEIGVKAKERFVGQTNIGGSGTRYVVEPGLSPTSATDSTPDPDRAWWNFDFSVDLGSRNLADTVVELAIDDPEGDNYTLDFGTDPTRSVIQNSWNIGFGFINTAMFGISPFGTGGLGTFQPSLQGPYDITLAVSDRATGTDLGSRTITAQVPAPAPLALLVPALVAVALRYRR